MPNPGHPSRGCHACRAMKVKCDELQPSCGRCERAGRTCSGYRTETDLFRSMNKSAEAKVRHRGSLMSTAAQANYKSSARDSMVLRSRSTLTPQPTIPPQPSTDWITQAVALLFHDIGFVDPRLRTIGLVDYLPVMYNASSSIHLTEGVKAAALLNLANAAKSDHLTVLARKTYGKALMDHRLAMRDSKRAATDETLTAVNMLAYYEMFCNERPLGHYFHAHLIGQSAILKMRGPAQFATPIGRLLFGMTNRVLLFRDLVLRQRPTLGIVDWPMTVYPIPQVDQGTRLTVRIVDICGRAREAGDVPLKRRQEAWVESLKCLATDALDADRDLQHHFQEAPAKWQCRSLLVRGDQYSLFTSPPTSTFKYLFDPESLTPFSAPPLPTLFTPEPGLHGNNKPNNDHPQTPWYPPRIDLYANLGIAVQWNTLRCIRLFLLRTMLDLIILSQQHAISPCPPSPPPDLHACMIATATDICASVPFILGDIDVAAVLLTAGARPNDDWALPGERMKPYTAMTFLWTLFHSCRVAMLEPAMRDWISEVMERMSIKGHFKIGFSLSQQVARSASSR